MAPVKTISNILKNNNIIVSLNSEHGLMSISHTIGNKFLIEEINSRLQTLISAIKMLGTCSILEGEGGQEAWGEVQWLQPPH